MAAPLVHHRHPEFRELFARVQENLRYVFQTSERVVTLVSSGTGAMEACIVNLLSAGDTIITVNGGKFGARWGEIARQYGVPVVELKVPWGEAVQPVRILEALQNHPGVKAVYLTHSETSTGAATDLQAISATVHEHSDALVCVDGITSVGAHELRFDAWGIDACVTGSQKGLMIPPGLAFVALSQKARAAMERATLPRFYFDLRRALAAAETNDTPWTPAIALVAALDLALAHMKEEGMDRIWERHKRLALGLRAGIEALGLRLFSDSPSYAVTPVWLPEGMSWKHFQSALKTENGVTIAGGQGEFTGRIFRIAHLGYFDELDMVAVVAALERALARCGYVVEPGRGVAAVQRTLMVP
ncbi:MAG: aminotransferase [Bacteroidetes bacterium]|nr:aminotransferase [Bacteroidota bacterium]